MKILITGAAGFVGAHITVFFAKAGINVFALDIVQNLFEVHSKYLRLKSLGISDSVKYNQKTVSNIYPNCSFIRLDVNDKENIDALFLSEKFDYVLHLASVEGIRNSLTNPKLVAETNISGFINVLEACKKNNVVHFVYGSSGRVYGSNVKIPYKVDDSADYPTTFLDAAKRSNELIAHSYSYLFRLPTTALRFFQIYGPNGRPDSVVFSTVKSVVDGNPVNVSNNGEALLDLTYIDDIYELIHKILLNPPKSKSYFSEYKFENISSAPFRIYNIAGGKPITWNIFIYYIEKRLARTAVKIYTEEYYGSKQGSYADITDLSYEYAFQQKTDIETGINLFIDWFLNYYKK